MDKFDEQLKAAQKVYEPKSTFVDATMQQVAAHKSRRWSVRVWAPALAGMAVVALVFVVLPIGGRTTKSGTSDTAKTSQTQSGVSTAQGSSNAGSGSASSGTDNASLENDLGGVQNSMNQESNDQASTNSALNDQQNEIVTPTT